MTNELNSLPLDQVDQRGLPFELKLSYSLYLHEETSRNECNERIPNLAIQPSTMFAVTRLWAEIFEVREDGGRLVWSRVWDEVVPINVICIQDTPVTVYQITAYDQLVKKIFDVQLCQPGWYIGSLCPLL